MRRRPLAAAALAVMLVGCGGAVRSLVTYHDPEGLFSVRLPMEDEISPSAPQTATSGPSLLSGVVALPPQPSATPATRLGGNLTSATPSDRTRFQILVVDGAGFTSVASLALYFLTGTAGFDVQVERSEQLDGLEGRLVVGEMSKDGRPTAGVAAVFALSPDGSLGYVIASVFPPGTWGDEEADLLSIVGSFRADVPPVLTTVPVGA